MLNNRFLICIGGIVWLIGALIGLNYMRLGWTLDQNGLSVFTGRLPYWDFTNLWGGGRLVLTGRVNHLFDVELYRTSLRALLSPLLLDQEWSYPPSMLLIGTPLALLPILPAYLIWSAATLGFLYFVAGWLGMEKWQRAAVLLSPPVLISLLLGQNGALTASLLIGGLLLARSRPTLSGIFFGLLTLKPHLGILVPICLLAAGSYRAFGSAMATALAIFLATAILFGWDVWVKFLTVTNPMMRTIMEAPYPQGYQMNAMTFFTLARSLGGGLAIAYSVQLVALLLASAAAGWLWRQRHVDDRVKAAITGALTLCATPYGYTYDAVSLALAVAALVPTRLAPVSLLALAWLYPAVNHVVAMHLCSLGVLAPAALALTALLNLRRRRASDTNHGVGAKAS